MKKRLLQVLLSARAKATQVNFTADQLTEENMKKFQQAQGGLSSALSRLMVTVEKYPDLKAMKTSVTFKLNLKEQKTASQ